MMRRGPLIERRPTPPVLVAYTAVVIVAGASALAWATANVPLNSGIAAGGLPPILPDPRLAGLVFWTAVGLLGSAWVRGYSGRQVLTLHLPFIVAAMTLGGPVAGGWVAVLSSFEAREFREAPWFGILSNHAVLALAGVAGGLAVSTIQLALGALVEPEIAMLLAVACGAFVFCSINIGLTAIVVALKENLGRDELGTVFDRSFRQTVGGEVVLGWLLVVVYLTIGWWAPVVCGVLVLLVWRANDDHEAITHDSLTGLLNRRGFEERFAATLRRVRRGRVRAALVMVDLDGFKAINDSLGHAAGDEVLRRSGDRLRGAVRYSDVTARLGGDEFVLLLTSVPDPGAAERVVIRVHDRLCAPIALADSDIGPTDVSVGASLGIVILDEATDVSALASADRAMYEAKRDGGGVTVASGT
jgi:diguanylate cyclase (GGDEF)-like protein